MAVRADTFFWFNGVGDVDHTNWGLYWAPIIRSGVLGDLRNGMEPYANSTGMFIYVKTGEAVIYGVRAIVENQIALPIAASDPNYPRKDLVVARAVFLNEGESYVELDVKTGTPAASPTVPSLTQIPAQTWEIPLAEVTIAANAVTINAGDIYDRRTWAAANGFREQTVSIAVADWNGSLEATKTVTGVLAGSASKVWDSPTESSRSMYMTSDVRMISNGQNTVTWKCTTKPTAALSVTVVWAA